MANLSTNITLSSTDVSTDALSMTVPAALVTKTPSLGISRVEALITNGSVLVPATSGTKYAYVKHMALKSDGESVSTNGVELSNIRTKPVRQVSLLTFAQAMVSGDTFICTVDGVVINGGIDIPWATSSAVTMSAIAVAIAAMTGVVSATVDSTGLIITITSASPGETFSITTITVTGNAAHAVTLLADGTGNSVLASGHFFARLTPLEWTFLPVKSLEGLQAMAGGTDPSEGVILEFAYWTKATE